MGHRYRIADRMEQIHPFYVMQLLARARELEAQGRSIIHMEVGEPDFDTPAPITRAGRQALAEGHTHYTPAAGLPELRQAIAGHYQRRYGLKLESERIVVTPGSSGALQLLMSVLLNPGDEVLLPDPGYPCNRHFVHLVGGMPVALPVGPESRYQPTAEAVASSWTGRTRLVLLGSPSNPTGSLLTQEELRAIHRVIRERGGILIVDEVYQGLVYEGKGSTALGIADDLFIINSFSKYFGMTGWRLGWLVAPAAYVEPIDRLAQNIFLSAPTPAQYAALAAFGEETEQILEQRRDEFRRRRDYLLPALEAEGFLFPVVPGGAFYLYGDCSGVTDDSFRFATELLEQAGVAVTPGLDFGSHLPERHLRFAYTTSIVNLQEGVTRIRGYLTR